MEPGRSRNGQDGNGADGGGGSRTAADNCGRGAAGMQREAGGRCDCTAGAEEITSACEKSFWEVSNFDRFSVVR